MSPTEGRQRAIDDILAWAYTRDPFWGLAQVKANYAAGLRDLSDDELRTHWRRAKLQHEAAQKLAELVQL